MKYFTIELLDKSKDFSYQDNEIAEKIWMENLKKYWSEFKKYEYRLPSEFIKEYKEHAFHDFDIKSINFYRNEVSNENEYNIEIKVCYDEIVYLIKYISVTKYNILLNSMDKVTENILLYNEILPIDNIKMSHEIILVNRNSIYIEFSNLLFSKVK